MVSYVWVFGTTAVGKETFIRKLIKNKNHKLISYLGLPQPLAIQEDSLSLSKEQRPLLLDKIIEENPEGGTLLIKAQGYDIYNLIPIKLKDLLPQDNHICIYLDAPTKVVRKRRLQRGTPIDPWDDHSDRFENILWAIRLQKAGMKVIWLDNSDVHLHMLKTPKLKILVNRIGGL
jgi:hypothetical protein